MYLVTDCLDGYQNVPMVILENIEDIALFLKKEFNLTVVEGNFENLEKGIVYVKDIENHRMMPSYVKYWKIEFGKDIGRVLEEIY